MALPTLLLLPGMDGTGQLFAPLSEALPSSLPRAVVRYSPSTPETYSTLEARVRAEIASVGGRVALLAESFSGPIAVRLAVSPPPNLTGIVLVATFLTPPVPRVLRLLARRPMFVLPPPRVAIRHFLVGEDADPVLVDGIRAAVRSIAPEVMATRAREILSVDVVDAFAQCQLPMMFVAPTRDRLVKASRARFQRLNLGIEWVEIEGPHLILQREPVAAAEVIHRFVRSL